jgi:hypothetical protein
MLINNIIPPRRSRTCPPHLFLRPLPLSPLSLDTRGFNRAIRIVEGLR